MDQSSYMKHTGHLDNAMDRIDIFFMPSVIIHITLSYIKANLNWHLSTLRGYINFVFVDANNVYRI